MKEMVCESSKDAEDVIVFGLETEMYREWIMRQHLAPI